MSAPFHPEIVVTRHDWRMLSADFLVGGVCAVLFERHGAEETNRFLAVFDGGYMVRSASEDFTNGLDVRLDLVNLGAGLLAKPRKAK